MKLVLSSKSPNIYTVKGDIGPLLKNRRAKILLRSNLPYVESETELEIKSVEPVEHIVSLLKLSAKFISADVVYDSNVTAELDCFKKEEEKFIAFSTAAENIKQNIDIADDLKTFADVLKRNMRARRLYPLQLLSAYHLAFSQNGCNFSVPGAGKTSIVYGAYAYLKSLNTDSVKRTDKLLIVGPLSSFAPWENEYEECFGESAKVKRINGDINLDDKKQYFYGDTAEITLISYSSLPSLKDAVKYFLKQNNVMVVLDEAHKIKNTQGGIIASAILEIASLCTSRVILTGTPAPNGYEDLYNLFHFIWPNRDVIHYSPSQLREMSKTSNDARIPKMMDNISPFFIRIRKKDLGIPPAIDVPRIKVPMKEAQRRLYDFIEQRFVDEINSKYADLHSSLVKAKLIRLQQVATNPELLKCKLSDFSDIVGEDLSSVDREDSLTMANILSSYQNETPAKFEKCAEIVREIIAGKGKVVIWAIFIKTIDDLSSYLKNVGIDCRILYGATPIASNEMTEDNTLYEATREGIIKEFHKENSSFKVIIANPFAVAESISLHKVCHNAIYLERSFNCAHFVQSKNRIHRYGLKEGTVTKYYYLVSEKSIDETIDKRLEIKENRMNLLTESTDIPLFDNLKEDGDEDIKAIISDYVKRTTLQIL